MKTVTIKTPIWKTRSIGIATHLLDDDVRVKISYRNKNGDLLYPNDFFLPKGYANQFPLQRMSSNIMVRLVPISSLTEIEDS